MAYQEPPFSQRQIIAFFLLAAVGGAIVFLFSESRYHWIPLIGFVLGATGVIGGSRLFQRHMLAVFTPRWRPLADIAAGALALGVIFGVISSLTKNGIIDRLSGWGFMLGIYCFGAGMIVGGIGFLNQARVALKRPRR